MYLFVDLNSFISAGENYFGKGFQLLPRLGLTHQNNRLITFENEVDGYPSKVLLESLKTVFRCHPIDQFFYNVDLIDTFNDCLQHLLEACTKQKVHYVNGGYLIPIQNAKQGDSIHRSLKSRINLPAFSGVAQEPTLAKYCCTLARIQKVDHGIVHWNDLSFIQQQKLLNYFPVKDKIADMTSALQENKRVCVIHSFHDQNTSFENVLHIYKNILNKICLNLQTQNLGVYGVTFFLLSDFLGDHKRQDVIHETFLLKTASYDSHTLFRIVKGFLRTSFTHRVDYRIGGVVLSDLTEMRSTVEDKPATVNTSTQQKNKLDCLIHEINHRFGSNTIQTAIDLLSIQIPISHA